MCLCHLVLVDGWFLSNSGTIYCLLFLFLKARWRTKPHWRLSKRVYWRAKPGLSECPSISTTNKVPFWHTSPFRNERNRRRWMAPKFLESDSRFTTNNQSSVLLITKNKKRPAVSEYFESHFPTLTNNQNLIFIRQLVPELWIIALTYKKHFSNGRSTKTCHFQASDPSNQELQPITISVNFTYGQKP